MVTKINSGNYLIVTLSKINFMPNVTLKKIF